MTRWAGLPAAGCYVASLLHLRIGCKSDRVREGGPERAGGQHSSWVSGVGGRRWSGAVEFVLVRWRRRVGHTAQGRDGAGRVPRSGGQGDAGPARAAAVRGHRASQGRVRQAGGARREAPSGAAARQWLGAQRRRHRVEVPAARGGVPRRAHAGRRGRAVQHRPHPRPGRRRPQGEVVLVDHRPQTVAGHRRTDGRARSQPAQRRAAVAAGHSRRTSPPGIARTSTRRS